MKNQNSIVGTIFIAVGAACPIVTYFTKTPMDAPTYFLFGIMFGGGLALWGRDN
jgi:hypothetical protein